MIFPIDERENQSTVVKQVHYIILRMLKIIDLVCKKHQIDYWLEYGTLLGAIRHKGFIPWDHEADIGMLRVDYIKFKQIIQDILPDDLFFQTSETDPFYKSGDIIEAKIRDRYSHYPGFEEFGWQNGIQIDIFVYDLYENWDNCIVNGFELIYSKGSIHLKFNEIEQVIDHEFEGIQLPVPIGYHEYLRRAYGNYMILPEATEQIFPNVDPLLPSNHSESRNWTERRK